MFTFSNKYSSYDECQFMLGYYPNGNIGLEIWSNTEGPITKVTVNPDVSVDKDSIAIKDYSENEGMIDWLISQGIIEDTPVRIIASAWVKIPVHRLTDHGKEMIGLTEN